MKELYDVRTKAKQGNNGQFDLPVKTGWQSRFVVTRSQLMSSFDGSMPAILTRRNAVASRSNGVCMKSMLA